MIKLIAYSATALVLCSCAALGIPETKLSKPINMASLNDGGSATAESIEKDLTRTSLAGGYYYVEAYPYTKALIVAQETEKGTKNMDTKEVIQKRINENVQSLVQSKSCIMFSVSTFSLESAKFSYWVAKFEDNKGKLSDVVFTNTAGVDSVPTPYQAMGFPWHNSSLGCVSKYDFQKGFKIHLIPQISKDAPKTTFEWLVPQVASPVATAQK